MAISVSSWECIFMNTTVVTKKYIQASQAKAINTNYTRLQHISAYMNRCG